MKTHLDPPSTTSTTQVQSNIDDRSIEEQSTNLFHSHLTTFCSSCMSLLLLLRWLIARNGTESSLNVSIVSRIPGDLIGDYLNNCIARPVTTFPGIGICIYPLQRVCVCVDKVCRSGKVTTNSVYWKGEIDLFPLL